MRSASRLTYTRAFAALFEGRPEARAELGPLHEKLLPLVDVYRALLKARHRRGALEFGVGTLYRVHGAPEEKKLDVLLETLNALGIGAELPQDVQPRDFRAITDRLGNSEERPFIESLIVRSMQQAVYQPQNIGHFGLALKHYAHFTSPIRRYPDLVVHRTLRALLSDADPHGMRIDGGQLAVAGAELTQLEKRADESDRYVSAWLKCVYLRDRIGQTFEGLIITVVESRVSLTSRWWRSMTVPAAGRRSPRTDRRRNRLRSPTAARRAGTVAADDGEGLRRSCRTCVAHPPRGAHHRRHHCRRA
jgi:exoribonuclease R